MEIYTKGGGKHGKHGLLASASIITSVSNIVVQVFEYYFGRKFVEKCPSHTLSQLKSFDFITSTSVLCLLTSKLVNEDGGLRIFAEDFSIFQKLTKFMPSQQRLSKALQASRAVRLA